tara:strand:- start:785 stop:1276 length:492 start_codon:yes stop_codon:yes gene_type:complete
MKIELTKKQADELLYALADYIDRVQEYIHDMDDWPADIPNKAEAIDREEHLRATADDLYSHIDLVASGPFKPWNGAQPEVKAKVIIAELVTRSFTFQSAGRTEEEAMSALEAAWEKHTHQYSSSANERMAMYKWAELREDVNIIEMPFGGAVRDREIIIGGAQ